MKLPNTATATLADRVFKQFTWFGVGSGKAALSRPAHQRVTHTIRQLQIK
jgi:hypothetical protein